MSTELDIEFPLARPRYWGGGSDVVVNLKCIKCKRNDTKVIYVRTFGERRMIGCRYCRTQVEVEVRPKRQSYI